MNIQKKEYKIGIDIGGTHTDAVLINRESKIELDTKSSTTNSIEEGVENALKEILTQFPTCSENIEGIYLGTTQATNALLQKQELYRVGVIRLAGHYPSSLPPGYQWPDEMLKAINLREMTIGGGYECHGKALSSLCKNEIRQAVDQLTEWGAQSLAIVGVFSPLNQQQELDVKRVVDAHTGGSIPLSLSHQIGGLGFIERENSTILNAALKKVMAEGFKRLENILDKLGISCPLKVTQNNGSLIELQRAIEYPILTISAGPTNSFIGGARLAGLKDSIIIDIGGTSTDVGVIKSGYPRRSLNCSTIGGIPLNFPMPDLLSIPLGGGSYIVRKKEGFQIGPLSCANNLKKESLSFGGTQLTLTDIALTLGYLSIKEARPLEIPTNTCEEIMQSLLGRLYQLLDRVSEKGLPIVLVGGGASLLPKLGEGFIVPSHAHVANAYGAALAEVAFTLDTVVSLQERGSILEELKEQALASAEKKGAQSPRIVDQVIIPYHYIPGHMARVILTASGSQKIIKE